MQTRPKKRYDGSPIKTRDRFFTLGCTLSLLTVSGAPEENAARRVRSRFSARRLDHLVVSLRHNERSVTPGRCTGGWRESRLAQRVTYAADVAEGPSLALRVGSYSPGDTVTITAPTPLRLRATARDPDGVRLLEIRAGRRILRSARPLQPEPVVTISGELLLNETTFLLARAVSETGRVGVSGTVRVQAAGDWGDGTAPLEAYPLASWTAPERSYRLHCRLRARQQFDGRLALRVGRGYRAEPLDFPVRLRAHDRSTIHVQLRPPAGQEFPAVVPLAIIAGSEAAWEGTMLVCPWAVDRFRPVGEPRLKRQGPRLGLVIADLQLRALKPARSVARLYFDCYSNGSAKAILIVNVEQPLPRRALTFREALPDERGWHTLKFDLRGAPLELDNRVTLSAGGDRSVLLGGIRLLER